MKRRIVAIGVALLGLGGAGQAAAETIGDVFNQVYPSTVVIRAKGSEVSPRGDGPPSPRQAPAFSSRRTAR